MRIFPQWPHFRWFLAFTLFPLAFHFFGCGEDVSNLPAQLHLPVSDIPGLPKAQGVHITGRLTTPNVDASFFLEEPFFNNPQRVASVRGDLKSISDYSNFSLLAEGLGSTLDKSGYFSVSNVPAGSSILLVAISGRVHLERRLIGTFRDGDTIDNLVINTRSTAVSLLYDGLSQKGKYQSLETLENHSLTLGLETVIIGLLQSSAKSAGTDVLKTDAVTALVKSYIDRF